jgi:hypothetical protein
MIIIAWIVDHTQVTRIVECTIATWIVVDRIAAARIARIVVPRVVVARIVERSHVARIVERTNAAKMIVVPWIVAEWLTVVRSIEHEMVLVMVARILKDRTVILVAGTREQTSALIMVDWMLWQHSTTNIASISLKLSAGSKL